MISDALVHITKPSLISVISSKPASITLTPASISLTPAAKTLESNFKEIRPWLSGPRHQSRPFHLNKNNLAWCQGGCSGHCRNRECEQRLNISHYIGHLPQSFKCHVFHQTLEIVMQIKSLISTHIISGLSCLCVGGFEITGKEEKKERKEERKGYKITKPFLPSPPSSILLVPVLVPGMSELVPSR